MHEKLRAAISDLDTGYPQIAAPAQHTPQGTPYLNQPGVHLLAKPAVSLEGLRPFLQGFGEELDFEQYLDDETELPSGTQLCKAAGQLCYASFGPKRTYNRDADRYFRNIKESGHGSVLEHANYSFLFYGVSRSLTHELIRHRAGMAFSQISQRYVSGKVLRFVERPEYVEDPELHSLFEARIDRAAKEYAEIAEILMKRQKEGSEILSADAKTDLRKKLQQTARSVLPNETEAPIVVTGNARSWRHIMEMRANPHAETEIRALMFRAYLVLSSLDPFLFGDYNIVALSDGTHAIENGYRKV